MAGLLCRFVGHAWRGIAYEPISYARCRLDMTQQVCRRCPTSRWVYGNWLDV